MQCWVVAMQRPRSVDRMQWQVGRGRAEPEGEPEGATQLPSRRASQREVLSLVLPGSPRTIDGWSGVSVGIGPLYCVTRKKDRPQLCTIETTRLLALRLCVRQAGREQPRGSMQSWLADRG